MEKNTLAIVAIIIAIIAVAGIALKPLPDVNVSQVDMRKTIETVGSASVLSDPDKVEVYLSIQTEASTAEAAQQDNTEKANAVISALSSFEVETSSYTISPVYNYERNVVSGYRAIHALKVTSANTAKAGEIVDTAVKSGANRIDRISFSLSDEKEKQIVNQAIGEAVKNAKSKADIVASSAGVSIIGVSRISESSSYTPVTRYAEASFDSVSSQITPGDVETTAYVSISYEIA